MILSGVYLVSFTILNLKYLSGQGDPLSPPSVGDRGVTLRGSPPAGGAAPAVGREVA